MFGFGKRKVVDRIAGDTSDFLFGKSSAGKYVNGRSALATSAVFACVRVLATSIADLPLHLYERTEDGQAEKAIDYPLYTLIHDQPNGEMSAYDFKVAMMTQLLINGNAFAQIIRNGRGEVMSLYILQSERMTIDRYTDTGALFYKYYVEGDENKETGKPGNRIFRPDDIFHIKCMSYDGIVGQSPIAMAKEAIGLSIAMEEYGSKFFANDARPGGVLEHPGIIKNPEKLRESWNAAFGGSANAHKIAVLEEGLKYTKISASAQESQLIEMRKFQIDEIARIFGIPPHMIGDLEKSSFSNIENQSREFVENTLMPYVDEWESQIQLKLISKQDKGRFFARFNLDGRMRADYSARMAGYAQGIQNGFLSPNDCRRLENMPLIPAEEGGDRYLCNGNMVPLSTAGEWNNNGTPKEGTE